MSSSSAGILYLVAMVCVVGATWGRFGALESAVAFLVMVILGVAGGAIIHKLGGWNEPPAAPPPITPTPARKPTTAKRSGPNV